MGQLGTRSLWFALSNNYCFLTFLLFLYVDLGVNLWSFDENVTSRWQCHDSTKMMVLGSSGPRTRSRTEPIVRDSANSGSRAAPKSHRVGPAPFRSPPRDAFFSIEGSRLERDNQGQSRPNSRLYEDPLHDYFPSISLDHEFDVGVSSRSHSRSESVPIPNADSFEASDADVTTRSTTAHQTRPSRTY